MRVVIQEDKVGVVRSYISFPSQRTEEIGKKMRLDGEWVACKLVKLYTVERKIDGGKAKARKVQKRMNE